MTTRSLEVPPQPLPSGFEAKSLFSRSRNEGSGGFSLATAENTAYGRNKGLYGQEASRVKPNHRGNWDGARGRGLGLCQRGRGFGRMGASEFTDGGLGPDLLRNNPNSRGKSGRARGDGDFHHRDMALDQETAGNDVGSADCTQPERNGSNRKSGRGANRGRGRGDSAYSRRIKERFGNHNQRNLADRKRNV